MLSIASAKAALASRRQQNQAPAATAPAARPAADQKPSQAAPKPERVEKKVGGENRNAERHPAAAIPSITGLRISPHGAEASLVNISASGVLAECGVRLQPGSVVTVNFEGTFQPTSADGRVARSSVASVAANGGLRYHVGISFTRPIVFDGAFIIATVASSEPGEQPRPATPAAPIVRNRW
jgi:hypothetical protein